MLQEKQSLVTDLEVVKWKMFFEQHEHLASIYNNFVLQMTTIYYAETRYPYVYMEMFLVCLSFFSNKISTLKL